MKRSLALALCLAFTAGATAAEKKKPKPKEEPRTAAMFKKLDTNKDGKLSMNEFTEKAANPTREGNIFGALDKDSDAFLSQKRILGQDPRQEEVAS